MATRKKANDSGRKNGKLSRRALITTLGAGLALTSVGKKAGLALTPEKAASGKKSPFPGMDEGGRCTSLNDLTKVCVEKHNGTWKLVVYDKDGKPSSYNTRFFFSVDLTSKKLKVYCSTPPGFSC